MTSGARHLRSLSLGQSATLGSRGFSLSESWGRNHGRRETGGEAEPRRETSGNKCRWSHFHAAMIDSWRYVSALWINSPGWINSVVQFAIGPLFFSFIHCFDRGSIKRGIRKGWVHELAYSDFAAHLFWSCPFGLWVRCCDWRNVVASDAPWVPMNWYYILLSCFLSMVCLGLVIPAPFAMPSKLRVLSDLTYSS